MDLFDLNRKIIYVKGGQTDGRIKVEKDELEESETASTSSVGDLREDEALEEEDSMFMSIEPPHTPKTIPTTVFLPYYKEKKIPKPKCSLKIRSFRQKIINTVALRQVTIITGATGCGKTTQVPQYIMDWHALRDLHCNIIVIQPRRVSVMSVCKRVCEERGWPVGSVCGFKVGLTSSVSPDTRLLYVTTGIFLQILLNRRHLDDYTHIIFDEVHEREQIMDFSLLIVKKLLASRSPNTKIILMSATAEATKYANFFPRKFKAKYEPAPIINVLSPSNHVVKIFYLESLAYLGKIPAVKCEGFNSWREIMSLCIKLLAQFDVLDYKSKTKAAVLIFLPGVGEIEEMYSLISNQITSACGYKWHPVPIHGSISAEDQDKAFHSAPSGYRKIVIATNIAESSITIPDVSIVIDFCCTKLLVTNPESKLTKLDPVWASKASLTQRAGRVGRVSNGIVYRMIPFDMMKAAIQNHSPPDIMRCLYEKTTLQTILLDMGDPVKFLSQVLDPPSRESIKRTVLVLKELGALPLRPRGRNPYAARSVTLLGKLMAVLPLDIAHTRMILLGYIYSVFKESIIIAACMSTRGVFSVGFNQKMKFYKERLRWANGSCSDSFCFLYLYTTWKQHKANGYFERTPGENEEIWAKEHCVQLKMLCEADKLVEDLIERLNAVGIKEDEGMQKVVWTDVEKELVLKLVVAGTFYPNYFYQSIGSSAFMEKDGVEALSGGDPFRMVYFTQFPRGEPFELYVDLIRNYLSGVCEDFKITTNSKSSVFVEFPRNGECIEVVNPDVPLDPGIPGDISTGVYTATKLKHISKSLEFRILTVPEAHKKRDEIKARKKKEEEEQEEDCIPYTVSFPSGVPSVEKISLPVDITHIVTPSQFWCSPLNENGIRLQNRLNLILINFKPYLKLFRNPPKVGQHCVVKCDEDKDLLYRGKILRAPVDINKYKCTESGNYQEDKADKKSWHAKVFLIDIGKTKIISNINIMKYSLNLYEATKEIPALSFECTLTEVRPSPFRSLKPVWAEEAVRDFINITNGADLVADVFSVVGDLVSIVLSKLITDGSEFIEICINDYLVKQGYAVECSERWLSEKYNRIRGGESWLDDTKKWKEDPYLNSDYDFDMMEVDRLIRLCGPCNPLEMGLTPLPFEMSSHSVTINGNSVNSVLLNTFSRDCFSKLFVCGHVSEPYVKSNLILSDTTLMPNIPGWAAIMPLIFAPAAELRVAADNSRYTGALCGLGVNRKGKAMFPEHDMEVPFDTLITNDDLVHINRIRFATSMMLVSEFYDGNMISIADRVRFKQIVQECVRNLLFTKRKVAPRINAENAYSWTPSYNFHHGNGPLIEEFDDMLTYQAHRGVKLVDSDKQSLLNRLNFLRDVVNNRFVNMTLFSKHKTFVDLAQFFLDSNAMSFLFFRRGYWDKLDCELCEIAFDTVDELGVHFLSEYHMNKEAELLAEIEQENNDDDDDDDSSSQEKRS